MENDDYGWGRDGITENLDVVRWRYHDDSGHGYQRGTIVYGGGNGKGKNKQIDKKYNLYHLSWDKQSIHLTITASEGGWGILVALQLQFCVVQGA